jgi:hypothetical protein
VFLPAGTTGDVTITVTAANIAGDGVPNIGDATDQDFALVCSNCVLAPTFTLSTAQLAPSVCVGENFSAKRCSRFGRQFHRAGQSESVRCPGRHKCKCDSYQRGSTGFGDRVDKGLGRRRSGSLPAASDRLVRSDHEEPARRSELRVEHTAGSCARCTGNGARNVDVHPTLSWQPSSQASSYLVEVASDAGFANIVVSAEVTDTTYTVSAGLDSSTQYFWRVIAQNGCGLSADQARGDQLFGDGFDGVVPPTAAFTFSTVALLGDCEIGTTRQVLFSDDMESGAPGWLLGGDVNGSRWKLGGFAHSGTHALVANHDPFLAFEQDLTSPNIVPARHALEDHAVIPESTVAIGLSGWQLHSRRAARNLDGQWSHSNASRRRPPDRSVRRHHFLHRQQSPAGQARLVRQSAGLPEFDRRPDAVRRAHRQSHVLDGRRHV